MDEMGCESRTATFWKVELVEVSLECISNRLGVAPDVEVDNIDQGECIPNRL